MTTIDTTEETTGKEGGKYCPLENVLIKQVKAQKRIDLLMVTYCMISKIMFQPPQCIGNQCAYGVNCPHLAVFPQRYQCQSSRITENVYVKFSQRLVFFKRPCKVLSF